MSFADGAEAQNESAAEFWRACLIGMPNDAWIEQGRGFERILVEKISSNQAALGLAQLGMGLERIFHLSGACFENVEQIPVTALEIFEHLAQLLCCNIGIEPQNSVDDMIGADLVRGIEVARLSCRLEGPDDDPRRVRPQIEALPIQEPGLGQGCSLEATEMDSRRYCWMKILKEASSGLPQQ